MPQTSIELMRWLDRAALLTAPEERTKVSLEVSAEEILKGFHAAVESSAAHPAAVTRYFNLASLIQCQYGRMERGEELCEASIELCLNRYQVTGEPQWLLGLIQPFVNRGRLRALAGRSAEALNIFRAAYFFVCGRGDLRLGEQCIPYTCGNAVLEAEPASRHVFTNVYAGDSVRACLMVEDHGALAEFLAASRPDFAEGQYAFRTLLEGEIRCMLAAGNPRRALELLKTLWEKCKADRPPDPVVLALFCDTYIQAKMPDAARKIANTLASYCEQMESDEKYARARKRALYHLAHRYAALGDTQAALEQARRSLAAARKLGDEPAAIRLACLIEELGGQPGEESAELAESTFYRMEHLLSLVAHRNGNGLDQRLHPLVNCLGACDGAGIRRMAGIETPVRNGHRGDEQWQPLRTCPAIDQVYEQLNAYARASIQW